MSTMKYLIVMIWIVCHYVLYGSILILSMWGIEMTTQEEKTRKIVIMVNRTENRLIFLSLKSSDAMLEDNLDAYIEKHYGLSLSEVEWMVY